MKENKRNIIFWCYGSICEPYLESELTKIANVYKIVTRSQDMECQPDEIINELYVKIDKYKPEFVFSINSFCDVSNVCQNTGTKYIGYKVDVPVNTLFCDKLSNECNMIFMFDKMQYKKFVYKNENGIHYLPLGADVFGIQKIIESASESIKKQYRADVSFEGSVYSEKDNLVKFFQYLTDKTRGYIDGIINIQKSLYEGNILEDCLTDRLINELTSLCPELCLDEDRKKYMISHYLLGMHLAQWREKKY